MTSDALKLENQICHRFYAISNAFARTYRPFLDDLDMTYPQYLIMMALWEKDNVTINELLAVTLIDGGAMSLILKKLDAKNYIQVIPAKNDKRVRYVHLTENGQHLKLRAHDIPARMACKINSLSKTECDQMIMLIDKLKGDLLSPSS